MNSLNQRPSETVVTKEEFDALPAQGPDFLLDTARIQARQDILGRQSIRLQRAECRVPLEASQKQREEMLRATIGKWLRWQEQDHWYLVSDITVGKPSFARDMQSGIVILGAQSYPLTASFKWRGPAPKPVRIELDGRTVKQDPEHRLTLKEAMKAWNILPRGRATPQKGR
mgnify:FL=1